MGDAAPPAVCLVACDPAVVARTRAALEPAGTVHTFTRDGLLDAQHALSAHGHAIVEASRRCDAVLVEWAFDEAPTINTLCYHVRAHAATPTIGLVTGVADVPACLAAGTDDAWTDGASWALVQARALAYRRLVDAAHRRAPAPGAPHTDPVAFGALRLDVPAHRFYVAGTEVVLTPREFALVRYLIAHARTLCTRQQILDAVWGIAFETGTNMVDVYMFFLRRKLEAHGLRGMIETVRGQGYRLVEAA